MSAPTKMKIVGTLKTFKLNLWESWCRPGGGGGAPGQWVRLAPVQAPSTLGRSLHLHSGSGGLVSVVHAPVVVPDRSHPSHKPPPAGFLVESVSEIATKKVKQ